MHGVPEDPASRRVWLADLSGRYPGAVNALKAARAAIPPRFPCDDDFFTQFIGFTLCPAHAFARTGAYVFEGTIDTNGDCGLLIVPRSLVPEAAGKVIVRCCKAGRLLKLVETELPALSDDVCEIDDAVDAARAAFLAWAYRAPATFVRRSLERSVFSDQCLTILLPMVRDSKCAEFRRAGGLVEITVDRCLLHRLFSGDETLTDADRLYQAAYTRYPYYRSRYPDLFDRVAPGETFGAVMVFADEGRRVVESMDAVLSAGLRDTPGPSVIQEDLYSFSPETVFRMMKDAKTCQSCGSTADVKLCNACKCTWYCSPACQKSDWPTHKKQCKVFQALVMD